MRLHQVQLLRHGHRVLACVAWRSVLSSTERRFWSERLRHVRTYVREDPSITYDLHAAFSKDPDNVNLEDALDDYTKIQQAAIRAGKRPPRKKKPKYDATGAYIGIRFTNQEVPLRVRERLIAEGMKMEPQFFVGRYGLNKELVKQIRSAFRHYEMVRIEVGSPWTDNTAKFAERLELRTGAVVLDRAGSRFFLYRGFTHADLARKGLLDPNCFTVGNEYEVRQRSRASLHQLREDQAAWRRGKAAYRKPSSLTPSRPRPSKPWDQHRNQQIRRMTHSTANRGARDRDWNNRETQDQKWFTSEMLDEDDIEEINYTLPKKKSAFIDVDDDPETILKDDGDNREEDEIEALAARIRYNAARLKGSVQTGLPPL